MRQVNIDQANLASCVSQAQREHVVLTRNGKPVVLLVGVEGLDPEQLELGASAKFWRLIARRRKQRVLSRAQLERRLNRKK